MNLAWLTIIANKCGWQAGKRAVSPARVIDRDHFHETSHVRGICELGYRQVKPPLRLRAALKS